METATSLIDPERDGEARAFVSKALAAITAPTLGPALEELAGDGERGEA